MSQGTSKSSETSESVPRECGYCEACCNGWSSAEILGHKMGDGIPCRFRRPDGCGIHECRPKLCRAFVCGRLKLDSPFPEAWRPDRIGPIIREGAWEGQRCRLLRFTGQDPSEELLEWVRGHTSSTGEPHIIKKRNSWLCYGKPEFQQAMSRSLSSKGQRQRWCLA